MRGHVYKVKSKFTIDNTDKFASFSRHLYIKKRELKIDLTLT